MANKEELTAIANSLGVAVDPEWTKKTIAEHIEAAKRMLANEKGESPNESLNDDFDIDESDGDDIDFGESDGDDSYLLNEFDEMHVNEAFVPFRRDKRMPGVVRTTRGNLRVLR